MISLEDREAQLRVPGKPNRLRVATELWGTFAHRGRGGG